MTVSTADVSVEVASLVGIVGTVGTGMAALPSVSQEVAPKQELMVGALEHLPAYATCTTPTHTLFLEIEYKYS